MSSGDKFVEINGVDELNELIKNFKASQKRSIWISTTRLAAKPLVKAMKSNANSKHSGKSGRFAKSHGNSPSRTKMSLKVGARAKNKGHQAHLLNSGTKDRSYTTKNGKIHRTGKVKASKYFDNAYNSKIREVEGNIAESFSTSVSKFIARAEKRAAKNKK